MRANSMPMPAEAPVISVTRSVTIQTLNQRHPRRGRDKTIGLWGEQPTTGHTRARSAQQNVWQRRDLAAQSRRTATLNFGHVWIGRPKRPAGTSDSCPGAILVTSGARCLALLDLMLEVDAVASGNAEQIGGAPQHIVLEFGDLAVREHHLPHHLDNA